MFVHIAREPQEDEVTLLKWLVFSSKYRQTVNTLDSTIIAKPPPHSPDLKCNAPTRSLSHLSSTPNGHNQTPQHRVDQYFWYSDWYPHPFDTHSSRFVTHRQSREQLSFLTNQTRRSSYRRSGLCASCLLDGLKRFECIGSPVRHPQASDHGFVRWSVLKPGQAQLSISAG